MDCTCEDFFAQLRQSIFKSKGEENTKETYNDLQRSNAQRFNKEKGELKGLDCKECKNKGMLMIVAEENGYVHTKIKECDCMVKRRNIERLEQSGLKDLIEKYKFSNYNAKEEWQKSILEKAKEFIKAKGQCFYIGGQVGCGKTHICTAICLQYIKHSYDTRYMLWRDDIMAMKLNMTEKYTNKIEELKRVSVLYIDDFFKIKKGEEPNISDINIAFEIINHRYNNKGLITIISSEMSIDDILAIDEAIGSRLYQMAKGYTINITKDRAKNVRLKNIV